MKEIEIKSILEALLFVSNNPVTTEEMLEVLKGVSRSGLERLIGELNQEYIGNGHSFRIEEIAGGWRMRTMPEFSPWIKQMLDIQHRERLSAPALETLAVVAYKQPITKAGIEGIRGVNADYILHSLVDRGLIRVAGRKDIAGRPFLYGTTTGFLEHFGLASLKELPGGSELKPKSSGGGKDGVKEAAQRG